MPIDDVNNAADTTDFKGFPPNNLMTCPLCGYPLDGLPAVYSCPECGFRYDSNSMVWVRPLPTSYQVIGGFQIGVFLVIISMMLGFAFPMTGYLVSNVPQVQIVYIALIFILLASSVLHLVFSICQQRRPPFAGLGPDGIFFRFLFGNYRTVDWSDIDEVRLKKELIGYEIIIRRVNGKVLRLSATFANSHDSQAFGEAALQHPQYRRNAEPPVGSESTMSHAPPADRTVA